MNGLPYKVEGERVALRLNPLLVREASDEEWGKRDQKATHIPKGEVLVKVDDSCLPLDIGSYTNIQALINEGHAQSLLVIGHLAPEAKPIVREIGKESYSATLQLLPIGFEGLAEETKNFLDY